MDAAPADLAGAALFFELRVESRESRERLAPSAECRVPRFVVLLLSTLDSQLASRLAPDDPNGGDRGAGVGGAGRLDAGLGGAFGLAEVVGGDQGRLDQGGVLGRLGAVAQ